MQYREIIKEQIEALQEKQRNEKLDTSPLEACVIAITIADLASKIKNEPPQKFIPEDSIHGKCENTVSCKCPEKEVTQEGQVQEQPKKTSTVPNDLDKLFKGIKSYPTDYFSDNQNCK